eukprot:2145550-Prymnesium_polylepis.1
MPKPRQMSGGTAQERSRGTENGQFGGKRAIACGAHAARRRGREQGAAGGDCIGARETEGPEGECRVEGRQRERRPGSLIRLQKLPPNVCSRSIATPLAINRSMPSARPGSLIRLQKLSPNV